MNCRQKDQQRLGTERGIAPFESCLLIDCLVWFGFIVMIRSSIDSASELW